MTDRTTFADARADARRDNERPTTSAAPRSQIAVRLNVATAAGGALGALTRVELDRLFPPTRGGWPWTTFLINVAGAVLLGYLASRLVERLPPSTYPRPFAGTGLCGALTTFSTFQLELVQLVREEHFWLAGSYAAASVACGLVSVFVASRTVRRARWNI